MIISIALRALTGTFITDMGRAEKETARAAKKMQKDLEEAGKVIGTALAAVTTATAALVKSAIDNMDRLDEAAQRVGVSAKQLSTLEYAAKRGAVSSEQLEAALGKLAKSASDTAAGTGTAAKGFEHLGISVKNTDGTLKSTEQLLKEAATEFAKYEDSAQKTAVAMAIFGKSGKDMLPFLNQGADGMRELQDRAKALGLEISDAAAAQAGDFNDAMGDMADLVRGVGNDIAQALLPKLTQIAEAFVDAGVGAREGGNNFEWLGTVAEYVAKTFTVLKAVIEGLTNLVAATFDSIVGVGQVAAGAVGGVVEGIKGSLKQLTGDFAGANESFMKMRGNFAEGWTEGAKTISTAWSTATDGIEVALAGMNATLDAIDKPIEKAAGSTETLRKNMQAFADEGAMAAAAKAADGLESAIRKIVDITSQLTAVDPVDQAWADYEKTMRDIADAAAKAEAENAKLGARGIEQAEILRMVDDAENAAADARERTIAAIERERDVTGQYVAELADEARLIGLTTAQQRAETIVMRALADAKRLNAAAGKEVVKVDTERLRALAKINEALSKAATINDASKSPILEMVDQAKELGDAIKAAFEEGMDPEIIAPMQKAVEKLNAQVAIQTLGSYKALLGAMQTFTKEGSKGFKAIEKGMAALQIVQDIIALKAAVTAVLTQGQGEPYSAWARMAAMAAAVAPFIASIGLSLKSFGGGGGKDMTSENRQASQGTGSILGDATAKSESILNAVEITANATQQLVGINRGMLNALHSLQNALGEAGNQLARGAADVEFGGLSQGFNLDILGKDPLTRWLSNAIFGGGRKIVDDGIIIAGGALNDMLESIVVGAYQTIRTDGGLFGSDKIKDRITDISDTFGRQFQLVIGSIADTVREGALALGLLPEEVEAALAAFRVEEIRISLKGLDAEEQQKEIEAVFSRLFDGLAGAVVPWIDQFQQVGEGLGETLVRVATGVQVTQEAVRYLGFALDETDPEKFAQISEGLLELVGGIDAMIEGMTAFMGAFAPANHLLEVAAGSLTSAFEQAGLVLPETRDAMWALMQTFDATTEEGREQIATLIRLAGVARDYFDLLDKAEKARLDYAIKASELMVELGQAGGFIAGRAEIEKWTTDTIRSLNDLARAAGRAGASEQDLVNVHAVAAQRIAALIAKLKDESRDLAATLGYITGGSGDTIESLNAQIASLSGASGDAADAIGQAIDGMREKMNLLLGDLSPFNDQRKLELALQGLREGTVDPQQVLEIGRRLYASTSNYTNLFNQVMGMANGRASFGSTTPGGNVGSSGDGRSLDELIAARDALVAAQRPEIADQLARRLAELSYATGDSFAELAESMGWTLGQLGADLSLTDEKLQAYLESLVAQFEAQDWSAISESFDDSITTNTDRIVDAIEGRTASLSEQMESTTIVAEKLESIAVRIDSLASTIVSSDRQTDATLGGALSGMAQETRELNLEIRASGGRRVAWVLER